MKCHPKPKSAEEGSEFLDSSIPKSTQYATKWLEKIFGKWQSSRRNKDANFEERRFKVEVDNVHSFI